MWLSSILSDPPDGIFKKVDGFLNKKLSKEDPRILKRKNIGEVTLHFFCTECKCTCVFHTQKDLRCIGVNDRAVSIDCVMSCSKCENMLIPTWFTVLCEAEYDIWDNDLAVRIQTRTFELPTGVTLIEDQFEGYSDLLQKARHAHNEGLGLGAAIYLRHILEQIVYKVAKKANISTLSDNGKTLSFKDLFEKVDKSEKIVPSKFSESRYELFAILSKIVHGHLDEQEAINKYPSLRRLVVSIIEKVKSEPEIKKALARAGMKGEGVNLEQNR